MIAIIFIILLIIGFFIFNPLTVNRDIVNGQRSFSVLGFSIYCIVCVGIFYYLMFNGNNINWWRNLAGKGAFERNNTLSPQQNFPQNTAPQNDYFVRNDIRWGAFPAKTYLAINDLSDYDGMSKSDIFALRRKIVDEVGKGLGGDNYEPTNEILGGIRDGRPWWGTEGILCKGQGSHASDGASRESSYYNNPFILLNLGLGRVMNGNPGKETCAGLWPKPTELVVYPDKKTIRVEYDLSGFMKEFEGSYFYKSVNETDWFEFGSINARDFGYKYAIAYQTQGIRFAHQPNATSGSRLNNYWCLGQSCQIDGGCNNICPSNDPFTFFVTSYPAYALFRLYKNPTDYQGEPDAYFEVYLN